MMRRTRGHQRGSAMLVTLIIIGALLAGAAVLVSVQLASNRSSDLTRSGMSALYCAEAGLSAARPFVAQNYTLPGASTGWGAALTASGATTPDLSEPSFISAGITVAGHDLDGDGNADFTVYLKDNGDEGTGTDDPQNDNDLQIFIVSKCIKYGDTPNEVQELIMFNGATQCNKEQIGGQDNNGNKNDGC